MMIDESLLTKALPKIPLKVQTYFDMKIKDLKREQMFIII